MSEFDSAPETYWHCYFGEDKQHPTGWAKKCNLSKSELIQTVIVPWHQRKQFFVGGRAVRNSEKIKSVKIAHTSQPSQVYEDRQNKQLAGSGIMTLSGVGFAAFHGGTDYTHELLGEDSTFANSRHKETERLMSEAPEGDPDRVFIIHGRNDDLVEEFRQWLSSLGLFAKSFEEIRADIGGSPSILDVVRRGMTEAHAIIVLITPDEFATLRPELRGKRDKPTEIERWQARPNVLFEAGMAFAMAGEQRTLLLVAGDAELFSDVSGIHFQRAPTDAAARDRLKKTLASMGCKVRDTSDHHKRGNFQAGPLHARPVQVNFDAPDEDAGPKK